jgi:hypothetical protein
VWAGNDFFIRLFLTFFVFRDSQFDRLYRNLPQISSDQPCVRLGRFSEGNRKDKAGSELVVIGLVKIIIFLKKIALTQEPSHTHG